MVQQIDSEAQEQGIMTNKRKQQTALGSSPVQVQCLCSSKHKWKHLMSALFCNQTSYQVCALLLLGVGLALNLTICICCCFLIALACTRQLTLDHTLCSPKHTL